MQVPLGEPNEDEVLRYLGYRGQALTEPLLAQLHRCTQRVWQAARPCAVYRVFALQGTQVPAAGLSLPGQNIAQHLDGCTSVVLFAATLGPDVETLLAQTQVRDMADAVIMDAAASTAIEIVCDTQEARLREEVEARGQYLTGRFSPGYGDLPLALQPQLCEVLDTRRRIGLAVTPGYILTPRKSVTALLGVADTPRSRRPGGCAACALRDTCAFRKEGKICGE